MSLCFSAVLIYTGIFSFVIPCVQFGRNAEALGESCMMYGLSQLVPILDVYCRTMVRGKIREQKGIEGSCGNDFLMHFCCGPCALAQEAQVCGSRYRMCSMKPYYYVGTCPWWSVDVPRIVNSELYFP